MRPCRTYAWELCERRCRVAAVEATDRHDRCLARECQSGGVVRSGRRRGPAVARCVVLQGGHEIAAGLPGVEQATESAAGTTGAPTEPTEPAAEPRDPPERAA